MGIELPTPSLHEGEARVTPQTVGERSRATSGSEYARTPQTAEVFTAERPAPQEIKTEQGVGDGSPASTQTNVTATTTQDPLTTTDPAITSLDDVPVIAADEDLIEKQWVESVKKVIKDTRSDPYRQSEAISRLQADYLQKRYGKTVGEGSAS